MEVQYGGTGDIVEDVFTYGGSRYCGINIVQTCAMIECVPFYTGDEGYLNGDQTGAVIECG